MTRLLVLGSAPLPSEKQLRLYAANLRTWHLVAPLLEDGHEVRLVAGRLPGTHPADLPPETRSVKEGLEYYSVTPEIFHDDAYLQRHCDEWQPDAILGVNTYPASRAVAIDTELPIWCDLNGWVMAEAQTKCRVYDDDAYLSHFWNMERAVLDRADVISTVSDAQAHATVGELAARGRLGKSTFGYRFTVTIPNAYRAVPRGAPGIVRGKVVPSDAFVVLWAGGYNTWTDVDLLFSALEAAMSREPRLVFVSTGGAIEGHDDHTFESFRRSVARSLYRDRYHFAGWVSTEDIPRYYSDADLGINIDSDNYETLYGARNRINEWMAAGVPVLTTRGTEVSRLVEREELGLVASIDDAEQVAAHLLWATEHREALSAIAKRARSFACAEFSYPRTTKPLREWVSSPRRAPDGGRRVAFSDIDFFADIDAVAPMSRQQLRSRLVELEAARKRAEEDLAAIHGSRMWRYWTCYHRIRRAVGRA